MLSRRRAVAGLAGAAATLISAPGALRANAQAPLQPSPPFELTAHDGTRFRTDRDFAGRPMLVYFGYTYCPDFCPSSLATFAAALHELEDAGRAPEDLVFLFVSVDPQRDSLQKLGEYVRNFHPSLIGATGAQEEIERIAAGWRVKYGRSKGSGGEDYLMDHPIYGYGLNRNHEVVSYLWHYASTKKLAEKIEALSRR